MRQKHCDRPGCHGKHKARGLCAYHYVKARRHGDLPDVSGPARSGETRTCPVCDTEFYAYPSFADRRGRYCSMSCRNRSYEGDGNPKWRGGRTITIQGYVYIYAPDHPHATSHGYVMEHRLVMEQIVGRHLTDEEQVHHINHVRDDNRPENLQLMANVHEHRRLHAYFEDVDCAWCGTTISRSKGHRERWPRHFCSRRCAAAAASEAAALTARSS